MLGFAPVGVSSLGSIAPGWRTVRHCSRCAPRPQQRNSRCCRVRAPVAHADSLSPTSASPFDDQLLDDDPLIVDLSDETQRTKKVRRRTGNLVSEIDREKPVEDTIDPALLPPVHLDDIAEYARTAVRAADKRKAEAPVVFRVANVSYITTFMVCFTGKSAPQIRAIANIVEDDLLKEHKLKPKESTRSTSSGWILLDYGDLMVHIFSPEQRVNYNMESLWRKGEPLDISDCIARAPDDAAFVDQPPASPSDSLGEDDDWLQ